MAYQHTAFEHNLDRTAPSRPLQKGTLVLWVWIENSLELFMGYDKENLTAERPPSATSVASSACLFGAITSWPSSTEYVFSQQWFWFRKSKEVKPSGPIRCVTTFSAGLLVDCSRTLDPWIWSRCHVKIHSEWSSVSFQSPIICSYALQLKITVGGKSGKIKLCALVSVMHVLKFGCTCCEVWVSLYQISVF